MFADSTDNMRSSILINIFSIRLWRSSKESLAGDCDGLLADLGCLVLGIFGKPNYKMNLWSLTIQKFFFFCFCCQELLGCENASKQVIMIKCTYHGA